MHRRCSARASKIHNRGAPSMHKPSPHTLILCWPGYALFRAPFMHFLLDKHKKNWPKSFLVSLKKRNNSNFRFRYLSKMLNKCCSVIISDSLCQFFKLCIIYKSSWAVNEINFIAIVKIASCNPTSVNNIEWGDELMYLPLDCGESLYGQAPWPWFARLPRQEYTHIVPQVCPVCQGLFQKICQGFEIISASAL